jgi:hypothetical protein
MLDFMISFGGVASEMSDLLRARFVPGAKAQDGEVGRALRRTLELHNAGRCFERDVELARLALLARQLREIETARPDVLDTDLRRRLLGARDDYHGARQEVTVARALIQAGLQFEHEPKGRPDFVVQGPAGEAGIECTSVHLQRPKAGNLAYKPQSAMRAKAAKPYAGPSVALGIGTTNVERVDELDRLELAGPLAATPYGSLFLFTSLVNLDVDPPAFESNYRRTDALSITPELLGLLDALWPRGRHGVEYSFVPPAP